MQTRIQKWGNSLGLRIPKAIAQQAGLSEGTTVDFVVRGNTIVINPHRYSLETMLSQITPANVHKEVDTGDIVGNEAW